MVTKIRENDYRKVGKIIRPDTRRRLPLPKSLVQEGISFQIWVNSDGQILLDPQVTIPASEAWVFQNPEILALAKQGLADTAEGRTSKIDLDTL
ncbi:hypothetical protein ACFLV2_02275 [Chloroflexota bacterium]